jgi:hypothetical protein
LAWLAVPLAAIAVAGCGGGSGGGDTSAATGTGATASTAAATGTSTDRTVASTTFAADLTVAGEQLNAVGTTLRNVTGVADLQRKVPRLSTALDRFDRAIARMRGYRLAEPNLETRRAQVAAAGPPTSARLRDFVAAARRGDLKRVRMLLPRLISALQAFSDALTT